MAATQGHCERVGRGARNGPKGEGAVRSRSGSLSLRVLDIAATTNNEGGNALETNAINANNSNSHARAFTADTQHRERGQTIGGLSMRLARGEGGRAPFLPLLLLLLSVVCGTTAQLQQEQRGGGAAAGGGGGGGGHGALSLPSLRLLALTTAGCDDLASRSTDLYSLVRSAREVSISTRIVRPQQQGAGTSQTASDGGVGAEVAVMSALARGEGDLALVPNLHVTLTAIDDATRAASADLLSWPLWASAFVPIVHLPDLGYSGGAGASGSRTLVLSAHVLAGVMCGQITRWNDARIIQLNPSFTLPDQPIEVVLQREGQGFVRSLALALQHADPAAFSSANLTVTSLPNWPTHLYAKHTRVDGLFAAASYVLSNPYALGVSLLGPALHIGSRIAALQTEHGVVVHASQASLTAAFDETALQPERHADGLRSWPWLQIISLVVPRLHSRQSCRARSEVVKFLRWFLNSAAISSSIAPQSGVAVLSSALLDQLHVEADLATLLRCADAPVNIGDVDPITSGGAAGLTLHVSSRSTIFLSYSQISRETHYKFVSFRDAASAAHNPTCNICSMPRNVLTFTFSSSFLLVSFLIPLMCASAV